jgi:hypothetical protein
MVWDVAISWQSDYRNLTTMKRNGGVVNGLTLNAQLTVKLSVFSRLQSLINQSSGFCGTASRRCPLSRLVEVRKHPLALMLRRPAGADGMSRALGEAHRRYTIIHARGRWTGHLFQSRCLCVPCSTGGRHFGICC